MAGQAKLTIRADFERPSEAAVAAFRDAPTGWVVDAQGRRGAIDHRIVPLIENARFVGTALTVRSRPADNLAPYAALKYAKPGDVLMVAADDCERASVMGDILLGMAKNAGIVAAVTDGLVRDIAGIEAVGIPVFARGLSPNSPEKDGPGSIGMPISIGGAVVEAGDLVVGDRDGVVVVPRSNVASVAGALAAVAEKERAMEKAVEAGVPYPAWLDARLEAADVAFVD